ncbi:GDYXXLXY domain-containing protein [uncultured Psychromonas sp.]|uniref:GDYXXLXY domain-containing protein n=1 Tax=uncultured Psychromonas sp. TaxID=173974 RepID=UPI0026144AC8|nr:GDYXXLXY domain-containing protein [uncultured Psychromonas sp.]
MQSKIVIGMLLVILAVMNFSIFSKEQHLKQGDTVYLKLAPVDPRSLMQGDYMALRFDAADQLYDALQSSNDDIEKGTHDGQIVVHLDENKVGDFRGIYHGQPLQENELRLNYRVRNDNIKFATNAFFFEEGTAALYEQARYGEFKVNKKGELLLNAMFTEQLTEITAE